MWIIARDSWSTALLLRWSDAAPDLRQKNATWELFSFLKMLELPSSMFQKKKLNTNSVEGKQVTANCGLSNHPSLPIGNIRPNPPRFPPPMARRTGSSSRGTKLRVIDRVHPDPWLVKSKFLYSGIISVIDVGFTDCHAEISQQPSPFV